MKKKTETLASLLITLVCTAMGCITIQPYSEITPYSAELRSNRIKSTLLLSQTNKLRVISLPTLDLTRRHNYTYNHQALETQYKTVNIRSLLINGFHASLLKNSPVMEVEENESGTWNDSPKDITFVSYVGNYYLYIESESYIQQ